jgi:hypothetical protein
MSDFLTIVPPDWTEFPSVAALVNESAIPAESIFYSIGQAGWSDIDFILSNAGVLPDGMAVSNARMVFTDNGYRFWAQLVSIAPGV